MNNKSASSLAFIYLAAVPFIIAAVGFGLGGFDDRINVPIWLLHSVLMIVLFRKIRTPISSEKQLSKPAALLFIPWVIYALFAGFGPPPSTPAEWMEAALQQQVRYALLVIGGISLTMGFALAADKLKGTPGESEARMSVALLYVAMPLYIVNMLYWGFYLTESFRIFTASDITKRPDWYIATRQFVYAISTVALCLLYGSSALLALSLKKSKVFTARACHVYFILSLFGLVCSLIPPSAPAPFDLVGYLVAVPAISFIIPYLIGLNLARLG